MSLRADFIARRFSDNPRIGALADSCRLHFFVFCAAAGFIHTVAIKIRVELGELAR